MIINCLGVEKGFLNRQLVAFDTEEALNHYFTILLIVDSCCHFQIIPCLLSILYYSLFLNIDILFIFEHL